MLGLDIKVILGGILSMTNLKGTKTEANLMRLKHVKKDMNKLQTYS